MRWRAPEDDGGFAIDDYNIERSLNDGGFSSLTTISAPTTAFSDTTLTAQDNAKYRVSATNTNAETGPFSNEASTTTSTSEAQTIKELLFDNWSLTGELAKAKTGDMTEPVHFFNRGQVPGNKFPKAITVQKINELGNENVIEHPKFLEQSDTFEITCFLQIIDSADDQFSVWIDLMQQMTSEVIRILKTVFSPSTDTGEFFRTVTNWTRDDTFFTDDPELTRTLRFTLTRIRSDEPQVFLGFGGVLAFDTSASQGDNKPGSDYVYTEVERVEIDEGFGQLPVLTKDQSKGAGVPEYERGLFSGIFSAIMYAKKDDLDGTTIEKLDNIYKTQNNSPIKNQNAEVVFLHANTNTEPTPATLTTTSFMKISRIRKLSEIEALVRYFVTGTLTRPTDYAVTS